MSVVRRVLATAGLAAVLMAPGGAAWAASPTPTPDPTVSASADPSATPTPDATPSPTDSPTGSPTAEPTAGGCDQNPEICQSGGTPGTTTDCGQVGPGGQPAAAPPPPGTVCIASGLNPGAPTDQVTSGAGAPATLPRTGPAPLLPTVALGSWLLLLGALAVVTGRRRTRST